MPNEHGILRRLLTIASPQLSEDWRALAGERFRNGLRRVADYFSKDVRAGEKLRAAPDIAWRAVDGLASEKHAKAAADYAKAENDRMEAELRRRTLEARTRHECAEADKSEAEAGIARIREVQARIELLKQLREIGVAVELSPDLSISVVPAPAIPEDASSPTSIISSEERGQVRGSLAKITLQIASSPPRDLIILYAWYYREGDRIEAGVEVCDVWEVVSSSPEYKNRWEIKSPVAGTLLEILVEEGRSLVPGDVLATIIPDP